MATYSVLLGDGRTAIEKADSEEAARTQAEEHNASNAVSVTKLDDSDESVWTDAQADNSNVHQHESNQPKLPDSADANNGPDTVENFPENAKAIATPNGPDSVGFDADAEAVVNAANAANAEEGNFDGND